MDSYLLFFIEGGLESDQISHFVAAVMLFQINQSEKQERFPFKPKELFKDVFFLVEIL